MRTKSFTLVELLVVTALMSVAISIAVLGLDGITQRGRLRSAASQIDALLNTTRTQAKSTGLPRVVVYKPGSDQVIVRKLEEQSGGWTWSQPIQFHVGRVEIERVVMEGEEAVCQDEEGWMVRIAADGRTRSHGVILKAGRAYAVLMVDGISSTEIYFQEQRPTAVTLDLLMMELRQGHDKG